LFVVISLNQKLKIVGRRQMDLRKK